MKMARTTEDIQGIDGATVPAGTKGLVRKEEGGTFTLMTFSMHKLATGVHRDFIEVSGLSTADGIHYSGTTLGPETSPKGGDPVYASSAEPPIAGEASHT